MKKWRTDTEPMVASCLAENEELTLFLLCGLPLSLLALHHSLISTYQCHNCTNCNKSSSPVISIHVLFFYPYRFLRGRSLKSFRTVFPQLGSSSTTPAAPCALATSCSCSATAIDSTWTCSLFSNKFGGWRKTKVFSTKLCLSLILYLVFHFVPKDNNNKVGNR